MNNAYDIEQAFAAIEEELIASMMRNMKRHKNWEDDEGFQWTMWQAEQLKALDKYKKQNRKKFQKKFSEINGSIRRIIEMAREQGGMDQELAILEAIKNGWKPPKQFSGAATTAAEFFKLNTRKLEALIKATENDFEKAEVAMLRMADDQYRQVIFNAQVYANTGAATYEKAVDMATKDFLSRGINCIEYANGARHTIQDYAEMAIRTAAKRAYLAGEGEKRQEWGISTVIVNKRGNPCPKCLPFVGKILIDDVWSGGKPEDGPYPLMSSAVAAGLYHPRCKDAHSTYFPGISDVPDDKFTESEIEEIESDYSLEQKRNIAQRNYERFSRLEENALDPDTKQLYAQKKEQWLKQYETYYKQGTNTEKDKEQYKKYRKLLRGHAPETFEEFRKIKYNNREEYGKLKHAYRIVNQYENNTGNMDPMQIVKLHDAAVSKKAKFTGKARKEANMGIMEIDGKTYIANSQVNDTLDPSYVNYKGDKEEIILKPTNPKFEATKVGTHMRDVDSEYKFFEYAAEIAEDGEPHTIVILSEKAMCKSCLDVMEEFKKRYPNVDIKVVSQKKSKAQKTHNTNHAFEYDVKREYDKNENN